MLVNEISGRIVECAVEVHRTLDRNSSFPLCVSASLRLCVKTRPADHFTQRVPDALRVPRVNLAIMRQ